MKKSNVPCCKTCGDSLLQGNESPYFPFCSKRCKMADLGRWFCGDYRISEPLPVEDMETWSESEP